MLAVVNAILGIVMFALVTGALVLSLSPADEDEEAADDLDGNDAGPLTPEPFQDGRLAELRKSDAFVWSQIGELVAIIAAARELVPSEGPVAEPLSSSMASLHGLLHNRKNSIAVGRGTVCALAPCSRGLRPCARSEEYGP